MTNDTGRKKRKQETKTDIDDILRRVDSMPIFDPPSPDEIIGYDENGLPAQHGANGPRAPLAAEGASLQNAFHFEAYRKEVLRDRRQKRQ